MNNEKHLKEIQKSYSLQPLNEESVDKNPFAQFRRWFEEAVNSGIPEANAMTLATANKAGISSARTVLLKGYDERGFIFYTNYGSAKGRDLEENPNASLVFLWKELARQIRITGRVEKTTVKESGAYFRSRPRGHQIGAWVSKQSETIPNREHLEKEFSRLIIEFEGKDIPLPPNWGGYRIIPTEFEFWQGRDSRLHDRICYTLTNNLWSISRKSP